MLALEICALKNKELYKNMAPIFRSLGLIVDDHSGAHCFQVYNSERSRGISISVPADAYGNRGGDEGLPSVFETALLDSYGSLVYESDLGYDEVKRFDTEEHIVRETRRILIMTPEEREADEDDDDDY